MKEEKKKAKRTKKPSPSAEAPTRVEAAEAAEEGEAGAALPDESSEPAPPSKPSAAAPRSTPPPAARADAPAAHARGTDLATKLSTSLSLGAVLFIAVLLNILAARHYRRWDFTKGGEFTLSDGTIDTLRSLDERVTIIVLLTRDTPMGVSLAEILDGYGQYTNKLDVEFVDPDNDRERMRQLEKEHGLLTGEDGGRRVTDAAMIVIQDKRRQYVQSAELVAVEDPDDMRSRPRLEYAITSAIRHVRTSDPPMICFSVGHNELSLEMGQSTGMAELVDRLQKNNFGVSVVFEPTADAPRDPLKNCQLLVVAAPRAPVPKDHAETMKKFIEDGGSALIAVGPIPNAAHTDWLDLGMQDVVGLAGVKVEADLVHELSRERIPQDSDGTSFFAESRVHPVTERLLREEEFLARPIVFQASSLTDLKGDVKPEPLLVTSQQSLGVVDYWRRVGDLKPSMNDLAGPLVVAVAAERPAPAGKERGGRLVVMSADNLMLGVNWSDASLEANALFVQSTFSWLASHERFLDIPDKPLKTTGLRITEEGMGSIFRYVVVFIPLAVTLVGIGVWYLRKRRRVLPPAETQEAT